MYDPMFDMVTERQQQIRQAALDAHKLAGLKSANPGLRQRLIYNLGGVLISYGTRLRQAVPEPCDSPAPVASYSLPEGCS